MLAESLRDPDIMVRASLPYSPNPNPVQRQAFARAYLDADRPADAMVWLQDPWGHLDDSRQGLLADALERLGRFEESSPIRQRMFERTLSDFYFQRWLEHLPEAARPEAVAHARQLTLRRDDLTAAPTLLLQLGDAAAAEDRLLAEPGRIDGHAMDTSSPAPRRGAPVRARLMKVGAAGPIEWRMTDSVRRPQSSGRYPLSASPHSHSMVAGGLLEMS